MLEKPVAGHGDIKVGKNQVLKKMNPSELMFYKKIKGLIRVNSGLKKVFPEILSIGPDNLVSITNVGKNINNPQFCDVKIGFSTFSKTEYVLNRNGQPYLGKSYKMFFLDQLKNSATLGFRVEGTSYCKKGKFFKPAYKTLEQFFGDNPLLYQKAISKITKMKKTLEDEDFTFLGSSFLIAVDKKNQNVEVKLIDLAHFFFIHQKPRLFKKLKKSFFKGTDNLITALTKLEKKASLKKSNNVINNPSHNLSYKDINWAPMGEDFDKKVNLDGSPNIKNQNFSNSKIWFNTIFTNLKPQHNNYSPKSENRLQAQQDILLRNICALTISTPLIGNQKSNNYDTDSTHSISELLSGGGRFGYIFEDKNMGKMFTNFLLTGNEDIDFKKLVTSEITIGGKIKKINEDSAANMANLYSRFSSHSQKLKKGTFIESKHYSSKVDHAIGMNFPIGGVGNSITHNRLTTQIGYEGHLDNKNTQLGSMLLKYDEEDNKARMMCGFESCAPYYKNPFGSNHGVISTIVKTVNKLAVKALNKLGIMKRSYKSLTKERSITGQSKGYSHGIFTSYGTNISNIDSEKFIKFKNLYNSIKKMEPNRQKEVIKQLLVSKTPRERYSIYIKCTNSYVKNVSLSNSKEHTKSKKIIEPTQKLNRIFDKGIFFKEKGKNVDLEM